MLRVKQMLFCSTFFFKCRNLRSDTDSFAKHLNPFYGHRAYPHFVKIKNQSANIFFLFCRVPKRSTANFTLPDEGTESPFKEITFVELQREEASKLVEKYNKVS